MESDITLWIKQVHGVDDETAHKIWCEYFPKLVRLARNKLGTHPQRSADDEDIALSAMNSFFRGADAGRFQLNDRNDLWKLLATITIRKVTAERRRFYAEKRGGGAVRGESVFHRAGADHEAGLAEALVDENRLPELAEAVTLVCEELLEQLNDEDLQKTALLKMEGYTNQEISDQLGCTLSRTKQRLARIRDKWKRHMPADG